MMEEQSMGISIGYEFKCRDNRSKCLKEDSKDGKDGKEGKDDVCPIVDINDLDDIEIIQ